MLRDRVVTAIALAAGFLAALLWLPAPGWTVLASGILLAAAWEWAGFARCATAGRLAYTIATTAAFVAGAYGLRLAAGAPGTIALVPLYAAAVVFWTIAAPLWLLRRPARPPAWLVLGVGWIALLPAFFALVQLRNVDWRVLLLFMTIVWIADIAAYFGGRRFGRHRLASRVSPGKTWEGLGAAVVATAVYALAWIALAPAATPALVRDLPWSPAWMAVLVEGLTVLSVIGDLLESAMKRQAELKDSGRLLPGHGGVLDRIDALTPVLPAAALVSLI